VTYNAPGSEEPEERPSWLYPLILFGITALIGAVILFLYLGPGIDDLTGRAVRPTGEAAALDVTIGARGFAIPANYIRLPDQRRAGATGEIELDAFLPDMHGFTDDDAEALKDVTRDSSVVSLILRAGAPELTERDRFDRIYARDADPSKPAFESHGFKVISMGENTGYAGEKVYTRETETGEFVVIRCTNDDKEHEIGGLCLREIAWGEGLTVVYSFRGGRLDAWKDVDDGVKALLTRLEPGAAAPK
jgi:hypothetical protein